MRNIDIRKALYKEKPIATLDEKNNENYNYSTKLNDGTQINFIVPLNDMGTAEFSNEMDAKLLCRWIVPID